jgi:hypothetical protein
MKMMTGYAEKKMAKPFYRSAKTDSFRLATHHDSSVQKFFSIQETYSLSLFDYTTQKYETVFSKPLPLHDFKVLNDGRIIVWYGNHLGLLIQQLDEKYQEFTKVDLLATKSNDQLELSFSDYKMRCVNDRVVVFNGHHLISYDIAAQDLVNRQEHKNKNEMLDVLLCPS